MLALERRKKIMDFIEKNDSIRVQDLSKKFEVTEETIRRDLDKLVEIGHIKRTYGGAVLNESVNKDTPFDTRKIQNIREKDIIAQIVIEYINDGDTLMMDSSSTALQVAKLLKQKEDVTVITNSVPIILELSRCNNINIMSSGGTLRRSSLSLVGCYAEEMLEKYNVDTTIISCKGIRMDKGIMESNEIEGRIKQVMIDAADKVFLLADGTKIDRTSFFTMSSFDNIDMFFTDTVLPKEWEVFLGRNNVQYITKN